LTSAPFDQYTKQSSSKRLTTSYDVTPRPFL
jgi:hypothetical protein